MDSDMSADELTNNSKAAEPTGEHSSSSVEDDAEPPVVWKNFRDGTIVDALNFDTKALVQPVINPKAAEVLRVYKQSMGSEVPITVIYPIRKVNTPTRGGVTLPKLIVYPSTCEVKTGPAKVPGAGNVQSPASESVESPAAKRSPIPEPDDELLPATNSVDASQAALEEMHQ